MSPHYRMFGLPCAFCGFPVHRIDVYPIGVRTVHEPGYGPPCYSVSATHQPRAGAVEPFSPPPLTTPAPVRSHQGAA